MEFFLRFLDKASEIPIQVELSDCFDYCKDAGTLMVNSCNVLQECPIFSSQHIGDVFDMIALGVLRSCDSGSIPPCILT